MPFSKAGLALSGIFLIVSGYLILTQGLFGESFIALILGLPWVLALVPFEFFNPESPILMYALILTPIAFNVIALYWIGALIGRRF